MQAKFVTYNFIHELVPVTLRVDMLLVLLN